MRKLYTYSISVCVCVREREKIVLRLRFYVDDKVDKGFTKSGNISVYN